MTTTSKRVIVYIDGFNLYHGLKSKSWEKYLWLNLKSLCLELIPKHHQLVGIKYFTTKITKSVDDPDKILRQKEYLKAVRSLIPFLEIIEGRYQSFQSHCKYCDTLVNCHNCGRPHIKPNEKKTDVNIATYLFVDLIENKCEDQILISGDSDYENTLVELRRLFPANELVVAFPPARQNNRLYGADKCTDWYVIPEYIIARSQFPDKVAYISLRGKSIVANKPPSWS